MVYSSKNKSAGIVIGIVILVLVSIILIPQLRVMTVVKLSSEIHQRNSFLDEEMIEITIPAGLATKEKDWFPIMNSYYDKSDFGHHVGKDVELLVLYNYGAFDSLWGTSSYYDSSSPYYGAFYGAYIIREKTDSNSFYGYEPGGRFIPEAIGKIPFYDQIYLALPSIGCPFSERMFQIKAEDIEEQISYAGYEDWTRVNSSIYTNGPAHKKEDFKLGYLQYGDPLMHKQGNKNFQRENFYGRIYIKTFEKSHVTICLYIMAIDKDVLEDCDKELLGQTVIRD